MTSFRKIESIFRNEHPHWVGDGFKVRQYFPSGRDKEFLTRFSPFILMDYNAPYQFLASDNASAGVGAHPHRGFETVTFALEGKIEHHDNRGNSGIIDSGDIQWMTAGSGLLHKEYHEKEFAKHDRILHMVQLWVNLPKEYKMIEPAYQAIKSADMGIFHAADDSFFAILYAGEAFGVKGPARTFSPINIFKLHVKAGKMASFHEPSDFNVGFLVTNGSGCVNNANIDATDFVLFSNGDGSISITADEELEVLVLSGKPLNEPVVAMGPFVMNTYEEIVQANIDYQNGAFGSFDF